MNPEEMLRSVWLRLQDGGVYMYPIFVVSVSMFALILHHFYGLRLLRRHLIRGWDGDVASVSCASPLGRLLREYHGARCSVPELNIRLREELVRNFLTRTGAGGRLILLCASVALLLGLLGTVSGMINTFEAIQIFGVGNTKSFAAGISEAPLTTQSGLLVGVIGLVAGHAIKRMQKRLGERMSRFVESAENQAKEEREVHRHG